MSKNTILAVVIILLNLIYIAGMISSDLKNYAYGSTPLGGKPWPIPERIEAENFDEGGDGVSYHVTKMKMLQILVAQLISFKANCGIPLMAVHPGNWLKQVPIHKCKLAG